MIFRLFGPMEMTVDGQPVLLGGNRQRAVLAVLLLHANEVLPRDLLVEESWSGRPPPGAPGTLQTYISRLRRVMADSGATIVCRGDGYQLVIDPDELDVACFHRFVGEGREALHERDHRRARELFRDALALWRGQPLADLAYESFAVEAIRHLEDERLAAEIGHVEAELHLGRSDATLVGNVQRLVGLYPDDERLREQLMLALYQCGRQAEALAAYQNARDLCATSTASNRASGCATWSARSSATLRRSIPRPPKRTFGLTAAWTSRW